MNRKNWKQSEVEFLKANIVALGVDGCAKALCRSFKSVWSRIQKLGLLPGDSRWWTKEQEQVLADNFHTMTSKGLSDLLRMNVSAVYHKAQRMGLKSSRWWTEKEDSFLKESYGTISIKEIGEVLNRTSNGVQGRARKLSLTTKNLLPKERYCVDCGKRLANKYMKPTHCKDCAPKHRVGADNAQWKGGVSTLYKLIQRNLWAVWKKPILERDKFRCRLCNSKDNLEVHHIKPLVVIRDRAIAEMPHLDISNYNDRVELAHLIVGRHVLEQGITLCQSCHKSYHTEKWDELLENPNASGEDNQQPSQSNVVQLLDWKVQRATAEDTTTDKADTSVPNADPISVMMCSELAGNRKK